MTTPEAARLAKCHECGMFCHPGEFHPFAACLMYMGCHDSEKVRANLAALSQPNEARDAARWQPIETCPETGFFLVTEDTAVRALWRFEGEWESPDYPAILGEWGDLIVGDDAKRLTGGRPLVVSQGVREPTHWMEVPHGMALPDEDDAAMSKEQP